ncbi:OxPP cycle protein OcpA [Actinomyces sp. Chiba101]|uniref:Glucose-6-phosphate dehydrogenase assembly protein OpcA n=1 Tax=Actinomyces denticolens TaxID=52767 RepID=A0ABY1I5R4_9ACTO|nr:MULTISPECIES: glucose-6-phosphate dehydrogenase assembly protein OpcA [Actinomyces]BAW93090.1 OxPP cycle protein OcpA [Actinomyces sp. Chiba101]GAV95681.1 hypothetical protein ADENT20671_2480 [Actinomyces denticolens]SHI63985.1 glucose-6-phosphate dehydrogenase assembly protein OpcA [Actinomyces denticolens]SUU05100.1 Glucose-6-P dehydrogenase subunit [Actinomyces denticolens]
MITTLTATTTARITSALLADEGAHGHSHVLTLLIACDAEHLEASLEAAHGASRDHPSRIIAVVPEREATQEPSGPRSRDGHVASDVRGHLDAEIRTGHDAGAGETIVLRPWGEAADHIDTLVVPFLLPDTPVVVWWPHECPPVPADDPLGRLATARITNTPALERPETALRGLAPRSRRGDIDLAWTRITLWRAMVASALAPALRGAGVTSMVIEGEHCNASVALMTSWLRLRLGVPVERRDVGGFKGIASVQARTPEGEITITRVDTDRVRVCRPDGREPQIATMTRRSDVTTLDEELRRLSPDPLYGEVLAAFLAEGPRAQEPQPSQEATR